MQAEIKQPGTLTPAERQERIRAVEREIADLKARWPDHTVAPSWWEKLEELEDELHALQAAGG